jgi:hypothetical protein
MATKTKKETKSTKVDIKNNDEYLAKYRRVYTANADRCAGFLVTLRLGLGTTLSWVGAIVEKKNGTSTFIINNAPYGHFFLSSDIGQFVHILDGKLDAKESKFSVSASCIVINDKFCNVFQKADPKRELKLRLASTIKALIPMPVFKAITAEYLLDNLNVHWFDMTFAKDGTLENTDLPVFAVINTGNANSASELKTELTFSGYRLIKPEVNNGKPGLVVSTKDSDNKIRFYPIETITFEETSSAEYKKVNKIAASYGEKL